MNLLARSRLLFFVTLSLFVSGYRSSEDDEATLKEILGYWERMNTVEFRFHSSGTLVRGGKTEYARQDSEGFYSYTRGGKQYTEYVTDSHFFDRLAKVKVARPGNGLTLELTEWKDSGGIQHTAVIADGGVSSIDGAPSPGGFIMNARIETYVSRDFVKHHAYNLVLPERRDGDPKLILQELSARPDRDPLNRLFLNRGNSMSFTLSRAKGLAPVRFESLDQGKAVIRTEYDLKEAKPGLWFPVHAVSEQLNDFPYRHELWIDDGSIRINEPVDKDRYELSIP
ncbi:MAG: hypothetical protein HY000_39485, partial [Planctomycetes bacterium]|nr:hypothetical protein [Planctomycetota bacterium]